MVMRIVTIAVLAILFLACFIILLVKKYLKDEYNCQFVKNEVLKVEERSKANKDYVFTASEDVSEYIKEYILSVRGKKKSFMCEYSKEVKSILYFLTIYDKNRKLIKVISIRDVKPGKYSKLVKLPTKARALNIVIHKVNDYEVDQHPVKAISVFRIIMYSLLWGISTFCLSNAIRLTYLELNAGYFIEEFLKQYNMIYYIISGGASLLLVIIMIILLLAKNRYFSKNRGEFYGSY